MEIRHCKTHFIVTNCVKVREYECYHTPHHSDRARGGTAIMMRHDIEHHFQIEIREENIQVVVGFYRGS